MTRILLQVVLLMVFSVLGRTTAQTSALATPCPNADSSFLANSSSSAWDEADNWSDGQVPDKTSEVVVDAGADTELGTFSRVSSLVIKSGAKLTVTGSLKLIPTAITCFRVNYCSGRGTCVAEDTCECDPGWTGSECAVDASLPDKRVSHLKQFLIAKRDTTRAFMSQ